MRRSVRDTPSRRFDPDDTRQRRAARCEGLATNGHHLSFELVTSTLYSFKEKTMGRPVVHWELMSKDPEKVSAFYERVFGWKIQHRPELNYRIVDTASQGGINGGIIKPPHPEPWPGNMTFYVDVEDLAEYRKKVLEA